MIYHYCSLEKLNKIITSKELFLFNANSMNDRSETLWIIQLINEELSKRKEQFNEADVKKLSTSFSLNRTYPYLSCFSSDSDLLSQWRAYADDGKGIAIGFNEEYLGVPKRIPVNTAVVKDSVGYFDCIYDENIQRKTINREIDASLLLIEQNEPKDWVLHKLAMQLIRLSVIFKNPTFSEEKEVRLIHVPMIMGDKENKTILMTSISDMYFLVKKDKIVSYFKFNLKDMFNSKLIPEIILGPKNITNRIEFGTYLSVNNLTETIIRDSIVPYR